MSEQDDASAVGLRESLKNILFVSKEIYIFSKAYFFVFAAMVLIEAVNPIVLAWLGGQVIQELANVANGDFERTRLIALIVVTAVVNLIYFVASTLEGAYRTNLRERLVVFQLTKLLKQRASASLLTYEKPETQKRSKYAEDGIHEFLWYLESVKAIISSVLGALGVIFVVFATVPWVLLVMVPLSILSIVWNHKLFVQYRRNWDAIKSNWQRSNEVYGMFMSESGLLEVRSLSLTGKLINIWKSERGKVIDVEEKDNKKHLVQNISLQLIESLVGVAVDLWLLFRLFAGAITVATFEQTRRLVSSFILMLSRLGRNISDINIIGVKIFDYRKIVDDISSEEGDSHHLSSTSKSINLKSLQMKNAVFSYSKQHDSNVLKDIDFSIEKGEKIAIVGANGSGKSTLLKCLLGFYELDEGEVLINGKKASVKDQVSLLKQISPLQQSISNYNFLKFGESVAIAGGKYDKKKINKVLEFVGLKKKVDELEDGLDSSVGYIDDGIKLSGGEYQRLAIARALYKEGQLTVLDEPTSAIDSNSEQTIVENLVNIKDKTMIMVSHRISLVALTDKIYVMKDGRIVETGTHKQLFKKGTEYYRLFEKQKKAISG